VPDSRDSEAVAETLNAINDAWVGGRAEDMRDHLHDDVVTVQPGFEMVIRGRDTCVASYAEFTGQATIDRFESTAPSVEVFGDTAIAWFAWTMRYAIGGESYHETGHDLFVFTRQGRPLARGLANAELAAGG
jgi:ketosteroid isomerase-like protein